MKEFLRLKTWAGPLTIGSFFAVGISGILMFFHLNVGVVKLAHEWLGLILVVGVVAHLIVNWDAFLAYFRKPLGGAIIAVLLIVGALSLIPSGGPPRRPPFREALGALEKSPLDLVAQVARRDSQSVTDSLRSQGIHVHQANQTILEIASDNGRQVAEVLTCVLGSAGELGRSPPRHD